jgi:hypothetical protein
MRPTSLGWFNNRRRWAAHVRLVCHDILNSLPSAGGTGKGMSTDGRRNVERPPVVRPVKLLPGRTVRAFAGIDQAPS